MSEDIRNRIEGRAMVLRGNDIDTDRIIPARYLRCVTFDEVGEHAFKDDRAQAKGDHPFDDERFEGANILIVGHNFGCGSSREHAPQALMRAGFDAFVGGSFAEIFFGNCTALGLPCVVLSVDELDELMDSVHVGPEHSVEIDLEAGHVRHRDRKWTHEIPHGTRNQLLGGSWNATSVLLGAGDAIEATAAKLPYLNDFAE
jgi:3-isopropylmalate/(R)-2-methylmalate dehydratase small subunit